MTNHSPRKPKRTLTGLVILGMLLGFLCLLSWALVSSVFIGARATSQKLKVLITKNKGATSGIPNALLQSIGHSQAVLQSKVLAHRGNTLGREAMSKTSDYLPDLSRNGVRVSSKTLHAWAQLKIKLSELLRVLKLTGQLFMIKILTLVTAIPLFLLLGVVGVVDGLSQREIRTAELGRESSYLFHQLNKWITRLVFWVLLAWVSSPLTITPQWVMVPMSILMAFMLSMTFSRFKKYV